MFAVGYAEEHLMGSFPSHERGVHPLCSANSGCGRHTGREPPHLHWLLDSISLIAFGGMWPGCVATDAESGHAEEGRKAWVCWWWHLQLWPVASMEHSAMVVKVTDVHGQGWLAEPQELDPWPLCSVLLSLTQQYKCCLAPPAWEFDREAEWAFLFLVLLYVLHSGENQET